MQRSTTPSRLALAGLLGLALGLSACGNDLGPTGSSSSSGSTGGSGGSSGGSTGGLNATFDPGFTASTNTPRSVQVTFTGETFGSLGLTYPPGASDDPFFVDGWEVTFQEYLVVLGDLQLNENALAVDPRTLGALVARKAGPYVVDVSRPGSLVAVDGTSPAGGIFQWTTKDDGSAFDPARKYSFSYAVKKAVLPATQVNLRAAQFADYELMVQKGWSKLVKGTATFKGAAGSKTGKFAALPDSFPFRFGWNDEGGVLNCINPAFGEDEGDPNVRGIQVTTTGAVRAEVTAHADHLFWDTLLEEGTPLRFDPYAAWATAGQLLDINALGSKSLAATFADGTPMPDRAPQVTAGFVTNQADPTRLTLGLNGVPAAQIKGLSDFMAFSAQASMHMNADGLCYNVGQHAADPFFTPRVQP